MIFGVLLRHRSLRVDAAAGELETFELPLCLLFLFDGPPFLHCVFSIIREGIAIISAAISTSLAGLRHLGQPLSGLARKY